MRKMGILLDAGGIILDETEMEQSFCDISVSILKRYVPKYSIKQFWEDTEEAVMAFAPRTRLYIFWKYCNNDMKMYDEISTEFQLFRKKNTTSLKIMKEIIPELKKLSSRFDLVLAGQYGSNVYDLLQSHGISELFKNRLSQDDFEITKPDPRYIERIVLASGFKPEQCIMVGDRIDNDVIPAKQNNIGTVFIRTGIYKNQKPRDPQEIPDISLDSIQGMAEQIINKWN